MNVFDTTPFLGFLRVDTKHFFSIHDFITIYVMKLRSHGVLNRQFSYIADIYHENNHEKHSTFHLIILTAQMFDFFFIHTVTLC